MSSIRLSNQQFLFTIYKYANGGQICYIPEPLCRWLTLASKPLFTLGNLGSLLWEIGSILTSLNSKDQAPVLTLSLVSSLLFTSAEVLHSLY
jgi:hypothetical protein